MYSKDNNHVYSMRKKLEEIDSKTFEILGIFYIRDKNGIYYMEDYLSGKYKKIENTDISSFGILSNHYSKEKNMVYYINTKIKEADPESFKVIDDNNNLSIKAEDNYYKGGEIVKKK